MGDKLPVLSGQECIRALQKVGFQFKRQRGSHMILHRNNPAPARTVVIPNHRELDIGTLRGIIRQAGLTVEEFLALLD